MKDPDKIAEGNNPDRLTEEQVGEGYRLLTLKEIQHRADTNYCVYDAGLWVGKWVDDTYLGTLPHKTYRIPVEDVKDRPLLPEETTAYVKPHYEVVKIPPGLPSTEKVIVPISELRAATGQPVEFLFHDGLPSIKI